MDFIKINWHCSINLERVRSLKSGDDCVYSAIKTIQNAEK
jgi:hypothetical protein